MADIVPKLTDVSSLKALSTILALPLLCVAYIFQTGADISWDGSVWFSVPEHLPESVQLNRLVLIFALKSVWVSFFAVLAYGLIAQLHAAVDFPVLQLASVVLLAFGTFGIFGPEHFKQLTLVNTFWFYSSIVWGLFLHSMREQLDKVG